MRRGRSLEAWMTTARLNGLYRPEFAFDERQQFPVGTVAPGMDPAGRDVTIDDARRLQTAEGLPEAEFFSRHSFVLLPHVSAVSDWDHAGPVYQAEIDHIVRERLFPGRNVEIEQGLNVVRRGRDTLTPIYADGVHSDGGVDLEDYVHNISAFASDEAATWWRNKYDRTEVLGLVWIDFWRTTNMRGPLDHMPLALCDPGTVEAQDVVPVEMTGIAPEGRQSRHLSLRFRPGQCWYYYSNMTGDELLAFKLAEFWKRPTSIRNCFHSAFDHADTPEDAQRRQSCEHRVAVLVLTD
jgi:hypothetical protein